jgi:RNA polymerase sigma factor (TIGR02999 family)
LESPDGEAFAGTLTRLLSQVDAGDRAAQDQFCEIVYNELLAIGRRMRRRSPGCSLATTDVVHEFLVHILADSRLGQMKNHRYFYAAAADQMRRLLVDHWRCQQTQIDGGRLQREGLDAWVNELTTSVASRCGGDLEALEAALTRIQRARPRQYEVVQLKFFVGLTNQQVAEALDISIDTVKRDWQIARARIGAYLVDDL